MKFRDFDEFLGKVEDEDDELESHVEVASKPEAETIRSSSSKEVKKPRKRHRKLKIFFFLLFVVLCVTFYLRYCNPYITDAMVEGKIVSIERRGVIFKTAEGQMILNAAIEDNSKMYSRDFIFSIPDDAVAAEARKAMENNQEVRVVYDRYFGSLPWRGASTTIVTEVIPLK